MPEIRKDPVFDRWVIIASGRGLRPNEFRPGGEVGYACPFCAGNEHLTPPTIYSLPGARGGWRLRVVRNKYPALVSESSSDNRRPVGVDSVGGIYNRMDALGFHEVVIETPEHGRLLEEMPAEAVSDVIKTFMLRIKEIKKDPRIKHVLLFKNTAATPAPACCIRIRR